MEVKFTMEKEHYWDCNRFIVHRTPSLRIRRICVLLFFTLVISGEIWLFNARVSAINPLIMIGLCLTLLPAWVWFFLWLHKYLYLKLISSLPGRVGFHTMNISSEGIKTTSVLGESKSPWSSFSEITESPSLLCFFINPRHAWIAPKSAFPDTEARAFLELAQSYQKYALYGEPLPAEPQSDKWPPPPRVME